MKKIAYFASLSIAIACMAALNFVGLRARAQSGAYSSPGNLSPFFSYSGCPVASGVTVQGVGNNYTQFNTWDLNACNSVYAFNSFNPSTHMQSAVLGMMEQSGIPDIGVNGVHGQATATNTSGTGGLLQGGSFESDLWSGASAGYVTGTGVSGTCEDHTGVLTTECDGGLFLAKNDATANGVGQMNGVHIQSNINGGAGVAVTTNCGLCIDNQAGIAGTNNYSIKTGTGINSLGDQTLLLGNFKQLTADFTDANASGLQTITGLSFTLPANVAENVSFQCNLMYSQATVVADTFGIQDATIAPTRLDAQGFMNTSATAQTFGNLANLTTTTATGIVTATPTVTTVNGVILSGVIQQPSNSSTTVINFDVQQSTAADVIVIKAGSFCRIW